MTDYGSRAAAAYCRQPAIAGHVDKVLNRRIRCWMRASGTRSSWISARRCRSVCNSGEPVGCGRTAVFQLLRAAPGLRACYRQNLAPLAGRVELNDCAIGDPAHTLLFLGRNNCGEASFFDIGEQRSEAVQVTTKPPSVLPRADILKMDVEGAEIEIMSGLARIEFDAVLLEYHSETNRRMVDQLLDQYVLVGGEIRTIDRGVLKYFHRRQLGRAVG